TIVSNAPERENRSLIFRYRFDPDQDTKIFAGARVFFAHDLRVTLEVIEFDPAGEVSVKISERQLDQIPGGDMPRTGALIPNEYVSPRPIPDALMSIAVEWRNEQRVPAALRRLLLRQPPELGSRKDGNPLVNPGESPADAALRVAASMRASTLCIQGPPGAGKTDTASRIIADSVKRG